MEVLRLSRDLWDRILDLSDLQHVVHKRPYSGEQFTSDIVHAWKIRRKSRSDGTSQFWVRQHVHANLTATSRDEGDFASSHCEPHSKSYDGEKRQTQSSQICRPQYPSKQLEFMDGITLLSSTIHFSSSSSLSFYTLRI